MTSTHIYTIFAVLLPLSCSLSLTASSCSDPYHLLQETTGYQSTICELLPHLKKKGLSLPSVLGRTLLLNHLMVKQRSAIFSAPPADWSLPSDTLCARKLQ